MAGLRTPPYLFILIFFIRNLWFYSFSFLFFRSPFGSSGGSIDTCQVLAQKTLLPTHTKNASLAKQNIQTGSGDQTLSSHPEKEAPLSKQLYWHFANS